MSEVVQMQIADFENMRVGKEYESLSDAKQDGLDWGLKDRQINKEWQEGAGQGVIVFILDTGEPDHKHLPKSPFSKNYTSSRTVRDYQGHSTHCGGIVHQWAPKATIAYKKVLGDDGRGQSDWTTNAINDTANWWSQEKSKGVYHSCIISLSLGGGYTRLQDLACHNAEKAGVVSVAAAGNSGANAGIDAPGNSKATICCAAYKIDQGIARFSSGGPEVDFAMPGKDILSTYLNNRFIRLDGTSMATPALAGLIACVLSSRPKDLWLKNTSGMRIELSKVVEDRGQPGKDNRFGLGIPNATDAIDDDLKW